MRDLIPEKFIPSLVEWMESDEDELAASSRDVAVDFLAQGMFIGGHYCSLIVALLSEHHDKN